MTYNDLVKTHTQRKVKALFHSGVQAWCLATIKKGIKEDGTKENFYFLVFGL
jgi:hypothetical protein